MSTYTKIRLLIGLVAIFVFVYMLNGLPCLGDANELNSNLSSIRMLQNNSMLSEISDEISIEKHLVVPKLSISELDKINIWGVFPRSIFEEVESIGRRHILTDKDEEKGRHYVVKDGDSLWSIAAEKLGAGCKYKEISKLNADILKNDHDLTIGMRLSLPNI